MSLILALAASLANIFATTLLANIPKLSFEKIFQSSLNLFFVGLIFLVSMISLKLAFDGQTQKYITYLVFISLSIIGNTLYLLLLSSRPADFIEMILISIILISLVFLVLKKY